MADSKGLNLTPLLERLGQNPAAIGLLGQLLGGGGDTAAQAATPTPNGDPVPDTDGAGIAAERMDEENDGSIPAGSAGVLLPPPPGRDHGKGRRDVLIALRPFLSSRRCASVDRLLRALELYEVIEDSRR